MTVKAVLAFNPSTPSSVLVNLAIDSDDYVRRKVQVPQPTRVIKLDGGRISIIDAIQLY